MATGDDDSGTGRGRPRDPGRHRAVLAATVELLVELGYDGVTFSVVARRAGVGRPLLYQWWGSKAALVQEALFRRAPRAATRVPAGAGFAETLTALVRDMVELQSRPEYRRGLPGLIADMVAEPELQERAERRFIAPVRAHYGEVFARAIADGEVRPDADGAAVMDTLRGAVMMHTLTRPPGQEEQLVQYLVGLVLRGVQR